MIDVLKQRACNVDPMSSAKMPPIFVLLRMKANRILHVDNLVMLHSVPLVVPSWDTKVTSEYT